MFEHQLEVDCRFTLSPKVIRLNHGYINNTCTRCSSKVHVVWRDLVLISERSKQANDDLEVSIMTLMSNGF